MLQKINKAKRYVSQEIGRTPSILELAQFLEVSVDELERYTTRTRNVISLESPLRSSSNLIEDRRTIGDFIVSDAPTPEEDAQREYLKEDIRAVINELPNRERDVLICRFGLEDGAPMSASETARHLGISVDRVRLVEGRALNKLRSPQRNYRLKEYIQEPVEPEQAKEEAPNSAEKIWFF
jgi:RNA polymerase sigma factor (sigma-70 family)